MHTETMLSSHVNFPLLVSEFNQTWKILAKLSIIKRNENPLNEPRDVT
jgi:hypothetical protein